ncbi:hypothetical protein BRADI_3g05081v3 [Brachypodium distachyon]|uniref:Uncharacterized protein n=1 Tax=Brachypodium distachyon TaxID=15368 RepID=A0A0Q3J5J9_BRADI|nr:hypothetical protein BRADI_3g05081v3 [Brachypodium distachyon]
MYSQFKEKRSKTNNNASVCRDKGESTTHLNRQIKNQEQWMGAGKEGEQQRKKRRKIDHGGDGAEEDERPVYQGCMAVFSTSSTAPRSSPASASTTSPGERERYEAAWGWRER